MNMDVQKIWLKVNEDYEEMGSATISETEFEYMKKRLDTLTALNRSTKLERLEVGGILAVLFIIDRISEFDCVFEKKWIRDIFEKAKKEFNA